MSLSHALQMTRILLCSNYECPTHHWFQHELVVSADATLVSKVYKNVHGYA